MRLLYITPYAPSPIRVRPYELLRSLCAERLRPTVLCPATAADAASLDQLRAWGIDVIAVPVTSAQRAVALVKGALAGLPLQAAYGVTGALRHHLRRLPGLAVRRGRGRDVPALPGGSLLRGEVV